MQIFDRECLQILQPKWSGTARQKKIMTVVAGSGNEALAGKPGMTVTLKLCEAPSRFGHLPLAPFRLPRDSEAKLDRTADQKVQQEHGSELDHGISFPARCLSEF